ncbi:MAG: methyltransferase domain-containing protein [Chitinophagaceae bacterium]|nr:methyltransferase domain-containing protein [Chitinophagaceae bacterium]
MQRNKIRQYYDATEIEANRLELDIFKLEGIRTKAIIERYLTAKQLAILDIGGGAGYYAFWLQGKGHSVSLVDLSPRNIELVAKHASAAIPLTSAAVGDAVQLDFGDEQFDLVLLLGPLYHLTDRGERVRAISEAKRVLKPGGILLSAVISRYASLIDGFQRDLVTDDRFFSLLKHDLKTGEHLNATDNPEYFTTAYFHTPQEIRAEITEAGMQIEKLIPVESFGWIANKFSEKEKDPGYMQKLMEIIGMVEANEDLLAISPHIIVAARKGLVD